MPIYVQKCKDCKHQFDILVPLREADTPQSCKKCGAATVRVIARTSFVLKGGGWYKDGYSGKSN